MSGESLKRLRSLLPFYIKLSPAYSLEASAQSEFLINSLVRITQPLDIPIIALGIEREATIAALIELGVGGVQGYAIGRPEQW